MKYLQFYFAIYVFHLISCQPFQKPDIQQRENESEGEVTLTLVDKNATQQTKALYANLWKIQSKGFMFGHHNSLMYGREWYNVPGRSDTKEVCGDYPAVYSLDFAEIMDDRHQSGDLNDARKRTILEARARGEVITACAHLNNPLTGGDSWDNSETTVVSEILKTGSPTNEKYLTWLDRMADFVSDLKDEQGELIPILFRPYHEHTQTWSWWGSSCTTQEEFINFWRFTVDYLIQEKGLHNLIFAISPQLDAATTKERILFRWPGDDYVDFIGIDSYHGTNTQALDTNLKNLEEVSREKLKPVGVTETGIEGVRDGSGQEYVNYWTEEILTPLVGKKISMVIVWRNKFDPLHEGHHFYGPWIKHASASDFVDFYGSSISLFSKDLPDMYSFPEDVFVD